MDPTSLEPDVDLLLGQISLRFITETPSSSRKDFITFQNKRAGSLVEAASSEVRDDPWLLACFPLFWEDLTAWHWPRASWQTEPGSLHTFPSEAAYFCQLTDLGENRVCSGSSPFHIFRFSLLLSQMFSKGAIAQQPCLSIRLSWLFSPTTSCTCGVELRSTLKNICSSTETYVRRIDVCDRVWVVFPALACSSRWPAVSLRVGQASVLPSVHILHRGETYRYAAAPVSPCFYFVLLPRSLYIPLYIPLPLHFLSLPAS